jgi:cobalamin-dependent methionine synthase I
MIIAADNLNALNPVFQDALHRLDPEPIRELVRRCEKAGAGALDLNPGFLARGKEDRMEFLVEKVQEVTDLPLILDGAKARVLERGLAAARRPPILNGVSLEREKLEEILPLAVSRRVEVIALLMDERSFAPPSLEEKIAVALEISEKAAAAGIERDGLIFDPVLPNLSWDDALFRIKEAVKTMRLLSSGAVFGAPVRTCAGLSNIRSGMRRLYPVSLDVTCGAVCAGAGLSMILADVLQPVVGDAMAWASKLS